MILPPQPLSRIPLHGATSRRAGGSLSPGPAAAIEGAKPQEDSQSVDSLAMVIWTKLTITQLLGWGIAPGTHRGGNFCPSSEVTMMVTTEERVSRLEGEYGHLATKADVAEVRVEIADLKGELRGAKLTLGVATGAVVVVLGVLQLVLKYVA